MLLLTTVTEIFFWFVSVAVMTAWSLGAEGVLTWLMSVDVLRTSVDKRRNEGLLS